MSYRIARILSLLIIALCWQAPPLIAQSARQKPAVTPSVTPSVTPAVTPSVTPSIQVYFGPRASDDPSGVFFNFMRFLDSAKSSIYGSAHEVDMVAVANKLAAKAAAGIDVQIVIESKWMKAPKDKTAIEILKKSKVKLIPDRSEEHTSELQ